MDMGRNTFASDLAQGSHLSGMRGEPWRQPSDAVAGAAYVRALPPGDTFLQRALAEATPAQLRIVIAECPLMSWGDPAADACFQALVDLKRHGFAARYDEHVVPVDTSDFLATHVVSCLPVDGALYALAAYRMIDTQRCTGFNLPFPARTLTVAARAALHTRAIDQFLRRHPTSSYIGSWTIHPAVHDNDALRQALREHFAVGSTLAHAGHASALLVGATLRFGVDRLLRGVGFRALDIEGETLAPLGAPHLHGERVQLMCHTGQPAVPPARRAAVADAWSHRLVLGTGASAQ